MAPRVSPTARALQTLEILQFQPGTTADQIAERLDVTERAARRYVAIPREAGVPVESSRGRYGGYRLGRGMRLPPVTFTRDEALVLVMAVLEGHPAATDTGALAGSALAKVIRALPENVGRQAAALREYASAAPDRRAAHPDPAVTSALVVAIASGCRVRFTPPDGLDPVAALEGNLGEGWRSRRDVRPRSGVTASPAPLYSWSSIARQLNLAEVDG